MAENAHQQVIEPIAPSEQDINLAARSSRLLAAHLDRGDIIRLRLDNSDQDITLPPSALRLLKQILDQFEQGNAVALTTVNTELTTQQAADLLGVSRPYVVKLLEQGELPFRKVGVRRRLQLHDVLIYKQQQDQHRRQALDELTQQAQELDMGY